MPAVCHRFSPASMAAAVWLSLVLSPLASASLCAQPQRILRVEPAHGRAGETLALEPSAKEFLEHLPQPLYVVPVVGLFRAGKSMTLNRLMNLSAPYQGGFGVGHTSATNTRGVSACAERLDDGRTVLWVDTEGLFSPEDFHSQIGPKMLSLALLTSSLVILLNSRTINSQFVDYFGQQSELAKILRQGLSNSGFPPDSLLPSEPRLKLFWTVVQPTALTPKEAEIQMQQFLNDRKVVWRDEYEHSSFLVPSGSDNVHDLVILDQLPDGRLSPDYLERTSHLRKAVLRSLSKGRSRTVSPASLGMEMELFLQLVNTKTFDASKASTAFKVQVVSRACEDFRDQLSQFQDRDIDAIKRGLPQIRDRILRNAAEDCANVVNLRSEIDSCLRNTERNFYVDHWQRAARRVREETIKKNSCFFWGEVARLEAQYNAAFEISPPISKEEREAAVINPQRERLMSCVHIFDLVVPFLPWLAGPVCCSYIEGGNWLSGIRSMIRDMGGLAVVLYATSTWLALFADVNFQLFNRFPSLLDFVMDLPLFLIANFQRVLNTFMILGLSHSGMRVYRHCKSAWMRNSQVVDGLLTLERKVNDLLKRSEADFKERLAVRALEAARAIRDGDAEGAVSALFLGLVVCEAVAADHSLKHIAEPRVLAAAAASLREFRQLAAGGMQACTPNNLGSLVVRCEWSELIGHMADLYLRLGSDQGG